MKAGETVAIVGPTGAGKTTLINLLQRVYDPSEGRILIDGIDTRTVSRKSLRQSIASVFQDAGLFNRTIEENIRIGCADADYDRVHAAAIAASAHDFILTKSAGYDSVVGERGAQLSGGERQRIAIARAVLKNAPILVLDEATSALDVETEARVKLAIDQVRQGRTTFIIAHRLTTVRDADRIIFMDNGRIVETGRFDELATSNGRFAALLRAGGLLNDEEVRRLSPHLGAERSGLIARRSQTDRVEPDDIEFGRRAACCIDAERHRRSPHLAAQASSVSLPSEIVGEPDAQKTIVDIAAAGDGGRSRERPAVPS